MVRIDDSGDETKCWLDFPDEVELLADEAREGGWERRIAVLLMGRVGLRASGVPTAKPEGLKRNDEGDYWELAVKGKNTKGGSKATRDAFVSDAVQRELSNYAKERDIAPSDPYIDASVDSIRRWVREAREELASESDRWQHVSSHDLRRSWATYHLVEKDVSVRVMMEIGGWSDYQSIEPYLSKPSPSKIGNELNQLSH
jgi:integrase